MRNRTLIKPLAQNERSLNVILLQNVLDVLGLPASGTEVAEGRAGENTLQQVRKLQTQLNIPVEESMLVDQFTAAAIERALEKQGLTVASRSFTVMGSVLRSDGQVKKRQQVLAFDIDLRAAGVYRNVKTVGELRKEAGFEFLGQGISNNRGNYRITFFDWQYARAERLKADVVVYAVERDEIIGSSRIAYSEDYSDKGLVTGLNIILTRKEERTEYEILMSGLNPFLQESGVSLEELARSTNQLVFTAKELDVPVIRVELAALAELIVKTEGKKQLSHELLYGLGRQNVQLSWYAFYKKSDEELGEAIQKSIQGRVIHEFNQNAIAAFLRILRSCTLQHTLEQKQDAEKNSLNAMLSNALPEQSQRQAFLNAWSSFQGPDFSEFWNKHLKEQTEFKDKPDLIASLLLTQQLTLLTGNHQELVKELQLNRKITTVQQLMELEKEDWIKIVETVGVPDFIQGDDEKEKIQLYASLIQSLLNSSHPTERIATMVRRNELPVEKNIVSKSISTFLSKNKRFDFATSRIHDFDEQLKEDMENDFQEVRSELMKIQRVFQVSATPEAMAVLMQNNLNSAYTIANIPRKSFIKTYGQALGGERIAFAIHQRASFISSKSEMTAMHMMEYSHSPSPDYSLGSSGYENAMKAIKNVVPNYTELFGAPDICECEDCRSVYSAAAYFIDLLRFLWRGEPNQDGKAPLDILAARRPDLLHLPLTCENTNTIIPYIDLANEVMEYYTVNDSLLNFEGYDTGEATAEELRANPQNFNLEAYRKLKDAKFPFTLPYHQPLDAIRTYSTHLNVSRYDAMNAMNPEPDSSTTNAIEAESLNLSPEEYVIFTDESFDGTPDATPLHQYFGYSSAPQVEKMSAVREFLSKSGIAYTDLVELVKTQFINPHQGTLDFLEKIFSYASIDATTIYQRLQQIESGTLNPANDPEIVGVLNDYNSANETNITASEFADWVTAHLSEFRQVITLYEPESKCDLDTTRLKTIQRIYEGGANSGITPQTWSKMHRFIRLWQKLGWTIHETDLILTAIGETDITPETISKLESVSRLYKAMKWKLNQLAVLWGNIDTYGEKSFYKKLFLNKAVQQIDEAFEADAWGNYLQDENEVLANHQPAILAAFRMTEEDLTAILQTAEVIDNATPRLLDLNTDILNIQNLSTIYRYVALSKTLKIRVPDLCKLIQLFGPKPFSTWDIQQEAFTSISPDDTHDFYVLAASTKTAGFKASVLEYILQGTLPPDSTIGLDKNKTLQVGKAIRDAFSAIEQDHPAILASPLTKEVITAKLSLTFQPEIVGRFVSMLDETATFEALADDNLDLAFPEELASKYQYVKGSGRLTGAGVMSDAERTELKALPNANSSFQAAVDELYATPEIFLSEHFNGVFNDLSEANAILLDHPAQPTAASFDERLAYVYEKFLPVLKNKLRRDAITQHIAALIGLTEAAAALLIANQIEKLIADLSMAGFSGNYFSDPNWNNSALQRVDSNVDFVWTDLAPDPLIPADNFSAKWESYITPPASGDYTLLIDVQEPDEAFHLYMDAALILEKASGDTNTAWEVEVPLNAAQMHSLKLEYAETTQNAGIQLRWKTATSAAEVVPSSAAYPASILDAFIAQATIFHRAAKFISGFKLSEGELNHFINWSTDFGNLNFQSLTADHWIRVRDYTLLRNNVVQAQAMLTDVFSLANRVNPAPTVAELKQVLSLATAWDPASVDFLVDTYFALTVEDFKNEIELNRIRDVIRIVSKTGISAETIAQWGRADTDFDALYETAQLMKSTVKAKYEEEDWLSVAGDLSDQIRENQKQALIAYLLTRPALQNWGAKDADGLFEYFLIDVQMSACMDTSRIVQANSSIQMFVNRCLLNKESKISSQIETGVSPDAIDKERWEWMKNYRVWEANRKVFLYPENWLEPEWRNDRSEFFKELESYLVQNDITDRSVEQAFRNYLTSLSEIAHLEVAGMCEEKEESGKLKYLHVFARTHNSPYKFFYRTWNEYQKWSAWEKVQLDIRGVDAAQKSGVHLIPVVWKGRLFLFWPEFMEKQVKQSEDSNTSVSEEFDEPMSSLEPQSYWEIRLAWSERVEGKWTPKQVSKEFIENDHMNYIPNESALRFSVEFSEENELHVYFLVETTDPREWYQEGRFDVADITSKFNADSGGWGWAHEEWDQNYSTLYQAVAGYCPLQLLDNLYLEAETDHKLLLPADVENYAPTFEDPFFFSERYRTYFVRPVKDRTLQRLKNPELFKPYLMGMAPYSKALDQQTFHEELEAQPVKTHTAKTGQKKAKSVASKASGVTILSSKSTSKAMAYEVSQVEHAFGSVQDAVVSVLGVWSDGFEFHTFYHPFSNQYVENLNQQEMDGLMESDTEIPSDKGETFEQIYVPNFLQGKVRKPSDFAKRTYYKENVCFDVYGANSIYNWELFFHAPLYIATRLSKNGKFEEAMKWFHYIFDPTTDEKPVAGKEKARYWKVKPFKTTPAESLEDWFRDLMPNTNPDYENPIIGEWRDNPFDPHLVASNRPLAYMKHTVIKYVENLIAWGDSLFRQDTMESVNEALQMYVIANHILGPYPEFVPKRGEIKAESYFTLQDKWDDFSNALVELENIFPYSSDVNVSNTSTGTNLLGIGSTLYFCIPPNDKLLEYWDTVADRLYKIRHCQNIEGVERKLALFAPPISPEALIQAASQGLSFGSILADLSSPPPIYRFGFLIQKANEFCGDVKTLGSTLLSVLEKKDAEELARVRASHETNMLELITAIKERQVLAANANKENLLKARESAAFRLQHYIDLLGNDSVTVPAVPTISASLNADSQLPADTTIATIATDVDEALVDSDESGVKLISREKEEIDKSEAAKWTAFGSGVADTLAGVFALIPQFDGEGTPFGVGAGAWWGGQNLGAASSALARAASTASSFLSQEAAQAARLASYIRREQDWTFQANLAAKEITQLDKQITSADIQIQVAQKELENHKQQIENSKEVELFLKDKFTNQELYQWMKEQLFAVYKQSYNLAYDMAKKAEKAYKFELGTDTASFIQYGYWDNSKQGLVAGEKLQLALRQLEKSYLEEYRREFELIKNVSIAMLNPLALIELRETGSCYIFLPEELFDLDFRGHFYRRIKSVRLSIPCVAGPYTTMNCTLRLLSNTVRINTTMNSEGKYEHENDEGLWIDDDRFRTSQVPISAIAASSGQNDPGLFDFNFRDERYLPFEKAGVISEWQIELSPEKELRQFDYSTISDVILHISYTARENGGIFREKANAYIKDYLMNTAELMDQPLLRMFSMRHEFPTEWHRFLHPSAVGGEQTLAFTIGKKRFPFFAQDRQIIVMKIEVFAKCTNAGDYHLLVSCTDINDEVVESIQITMPQNSKYGGINKATINTNDAGLNLEELAVDQEMTLKLKRSTAADFTALNADEVQDLFFVMHYKLA
jgi:Tc toxin complex TcA C-terminal TcB-binding domain/ABC toxin N-terminal region/Neuraminidase-like domain/PA14 domain/Salmonella virulence plasmid 28.1kDa A protein